MQSSVISFIDVDNHFEEGLAHSGYSFVGRKERKKEEKKRSWKGGRKEEREGRRKKGKKKGGRKRKRINLLAQYHPLGNKFSQIKGCGPHISSGSACPPLHRNLQSRRSDHVTYIVKLVMKAAAGICIRNSISWSSEALFSILQETVVKA